MFASLVESNFLLTLDEEATRRIAEDRAVYDPARQKVFGYCRTHDLIVSDVGKLLGISDPSDATIRIYCDKAMHHAKAIADLLYPMSKWTRMRAAVVDEEYIVEFEIVPLVYVTAIRSHRNIALRTLLSPVELDGTLYMSPEIELIDLCRRLYNPADDWDEAPRVQPLLDMVRARVKSKVLGGKKHPSKKKCVACGRGDLVSMQKLILTEFRDVEHAIVGHWAQSIMDGTLPDAEKLQLIVKGDMDAILQRIVDITQSHSKFDITFAKQHLYIPKDFRTARYTVYVMYPSFHGNKPIKKPLMDIFNSGNFELIPYEIHSGYRIANSYVRIRLLLVDLWIVRLVHAIELINTDLLRKRIEFIMSAIDAIKVAEPAQYFGVHSDYSIAKKIATLGKQQFPYYPKASPS
jgi:hypothetical protein